MSSMTEKLLATIHAWQSQNQDDAVGGDYEPDTDFQLEDVEVVDDKEEVIDEYAPSDPEDECVTITIPIAVVRAMIKRTRRFPTGEQAIARCAELRVELENLLIVHDQQQKHFGSTPS